MSTYQFLTKREKRRTYWKKSRRTIGKRIKYLYNNKNTLTSIVSFNDVQVPINNEYNLFGQVIKTVTDGRIVEYEYDDLGRQIATIDHPTIINSIEVKRFMTNMVVFQFHE
jgi:YD repeat-containing protein